ncbi:hypothetical protein H0H93_010368 [Arthromyces matolae]|nr:hypothetical protein H0H93_010368 [Arthromyces matolae]
MSQQVLMLYGVQSIAINGKIPMVKRDKLVAQLYDDNQPARVIIISSVGSAGLNLSCADTVIMLDQAWSAQEERQIYGRAHRQPQKRTVRVIHLLAEDSADLILHGLARGKKHMHEAFVDKEKGEELRRLFSGIAVDNIEDEVIPSDDEGQTKKKTRGRKEPKRSKSKLVVDDSDVPDENPKANASSDFVSLPNTDIEESMSIPPTDIDAITDASHMSDGLHFETEDNITDASHLSDGYQLETEDPITEEDGTVEVKRKAVESGEEGGKGAKDSEIRDTGDGAKAANTSDAPPVKRARQGTIGDEGRTRIMGQDASSSKFFLAMNLIGSSPTLTGASGPPINPLSPTRQFLVARGDSTAVAQIRQGLAASRPSTSAASSVKPGRNPFVPSAGPSRAPGSLDDVAGPPPKSALLGFRPAGQVGKAVPKKKKKTAE